MTTEVTEAPSTDLVVAPPPGPSSALMIQPGQDRFNEMQRAALEQMGAAGASEADQLVFFHQCVRVGLDPFLKQIYLITRMVNEKVGNAWRKVPKSTIQTGIDGYRLIAHRAADRSGSVWGYEGDPMWMGEDLKWVPVWRGPKPPIAAKIVVLRDGMRFPGVCNYDEFVQMTSAYDGGGDPSKAKPAGPNSMWQRMPANQLLKCAEAKALRMAFPHDLSGIYVDAEMPMVVDTDGTPVTAARRKVGSRLRAAVAAAPTEAPAAAGEEGTVDAAPEPPVKPTRQQYDDLSKLFESLDITDGDVKLAWAGRALGETVTDPGALTGPQVADVIAYLQAEVLDRQPIDPDGKLMRHMQAVLGKYGLPSHGEARHEFVAEILHMDTLESFNNLTDGDARTVIVEVERQMKVAEEKGVGGDGVETSGA